MTKEKEEEEKESGKQICTLKFTERGERERRTARDRSAREKKRKEQIVSTLTYSSNETERDTHQSR